MPIATLLALIVIEIFRSLPAIWRLKTTGSDDGWSLSSLGIYAAVSIPWIGLPLIYSSLYLLIPAIIWLILHLFICYYVLKIRSSLKKKSHIFWWTFLTTSTSTIITGTVAYFFQGIDGIETVFSFIIIAATIIQVIPAVYTGLTSKTTMGVSIPALTVNAIEGGIFLLIGAGIINGLLGYNDSSFTYIIYGSLALVNYVPRLTRVIYRRSKQIE